MPNKIECGLQDFHKGIAFGIFKMYWQDLVTWIYVSEADSDENAYYVHFLNCPHKTTIASCKLLTEERFFRLNSSSTITVAEFALLHFSF